MTIDDATVDRIATLAKLQFDDAAKEAIKGDMNKILDFMEKLNAIDTDGVEPLIFMTDEVNVLRKDEVKMEITQEQALSNAPKHDPYYFRVPKVLGKGEE